MLCPKVASRALLSPNLFTFIRWVIRQDHVRRVEEPLILPLDKVPSRPQGFS